MLKEQNMYLRGLHDQRHHCEGVRKLPKHGFKFPLDKYDEISSNLHGILRLKELGIQIFSKGFFIIVTTQRREVLLTK